MPQGTISAILMIVCMVNLNVLQFISGCFGRGVHVYIHLFKLRTYLILQFTDNVFLLSNIVLLMG